jgi:hypothetical protein
VGREFKTRALTLAVFCVLALASIWPGVKWWSSHAPRDYEECSENAETIASSKEERATLVNQCGVQFAGRRKMGGGYTYYDFMQNRHFDIAGPNPSPEELKQIDLQYTIYLDTQRQEAVSAALAKKQNEQIRADLEKVQQPGVGPPLVITPKNVPPTVAKGPVGRPKAQHCDDGSLSCSFSKLSAAIRNAFGSSSKSKP